MVYVPLVLSQSLPNSVCTVIRQGVEPLLQDVHQMLATIGEPNAVAPPRQLQVPIALVLLATVAGVSKTLLHPLQEKSGDGPRFKECLNRYFPWGIDPPTGVSPECAGKILYKFFRNPLVHSLGLNNSGHPVVKIVQVLRGTGDAENRVEELERLKVKPYSEPCLVVTLEKQVLCLDPFYWGVRKLVEQWSYDDAQILHADKRLIRKRET